MADQDQGQAGNVAEGGPVDDPRDEAASLFMQLVDWDGTDLKRVYEPISQQIGYLFSLFVLILVLRIVYGVYWKKRREYRERTTPYRVIKPPQNVADGKTDKRVVAVLGGTGFVGSHVVDRLIETGEYYVYSLGRRFPSDRVNPDVDAIIQVDMMDFEGLCSAFQGVDTVVHAAAALPNVYLSLDEMWRINKFGAENVVAAAQKCGVKNLIFVSGLQCKPPIKDHMTKTLLNCLYLIEQHVVEASKTSSLKTCTLAFGVIYGLRNPLYEMILEKKLTRSPLLDLPGSFIPVEYVAGLIIRAEKKLSGGDVAVVGKSFKVGGCRSTNKEFHTIPEWELELKHLPLMVLKLMSYINLYVAKVFGWAPMGADLSPTICSFLEVVEEDVDNSIVEGALEVGKVPHIKEGVQRMVERFRKKQEGIKKNK